MMGLLTRREMGGRRLELGAGAEGVGPGESWMGLFTEGRRVGHLHLVRELETRHDRPGLTMRLEARLLLNLLDRPTDFDLSGWMWHPADGLSTELELAVRSAGYDLRMAGKVENGELVGEIHSAGDVTELRIPVDRKLVLANGFGAVFSFPPMEVGEEYRLDSIDPLTLSKSEVKVRCTAHETLEIAGERVAARRLAVETSGLRSLAWIDEHGELLQAETPFGMVLRKIRPEEILTADTRDP